jgi:hypothetical protein
LSKETERRRFIKFLGDWTKNPKGTWQWQAMSNQSANMLRLLIELVMVADHKLDKIIKQKIINIISEATGFPPDKVSEQVYNQTKASAKK